MTSVGPEDKKEAMKWARDSAMEFQKLAVAMPTGILAIFFLALTGKIDPPLDGNEQGCAVGVIFTMSVACAIAIVTWMIDVGTNAAAAAAETGPPRPTGRISLWLVAFAVFFGIGLFCAFVYLNLRIHHSALIPTSMPSTSH